ncbi:SEPT14 [Cervus elaphus hippelaphus]|uniref:SEPT14 n=1 Tax=Cervus elaphus hippelaphus TaxID=46360 RepID=A0A212CYT1_CEREH|nr:SEPT14 [Cervus elaphus hippelaphus]
MGPVDREVTAGSAPHQGEAKVGGSCTALSGHWIYDLSNFENDLSQFMLHVLCSRDRERFEKHNIPNGALLESIMGKGSHAAAIRHPKTTPFCDGARPAVTSELHSFGVRPAERRAERDGVTSYAGRSAPDRPLIGCESSQSLFILSSNNVPETMPNQKEDTIRCLNMLGHFGFDCLAHQLVDKSVQQGFFFNILCVGETGIGKSTLIDTLFNTNLKDKKSSHFYSSVGLKIQTYELQENNVQLKLTVVKTVGYGDQINKEASYQPIVDYLDAQFESYLQEELKIKRSLGDYHDSRVHVCLYFISPTGHSLKSLDILTMKNIDSKVNIIPVIAKADAISKSDLQTFKCEIMNELISNGIQIYQFPTDDETTTHTNSSMNGLLPFAVVGSTDEVKVGKRTVRGQIYEAKRQELLEQCQSEEEELKQKFMQRLQDKFEHLKKIQQEETMRLEEERRQLEEEILAFYKMKASSGTLQDSSSPCSNDMLKSPPGMLDFHNVSRRGLASQRAPAAPDKML